MECNKCGSSKIETRIVRNDEGKITNEHRVCMICRSADISGDKPQLLTIELNDIDSVPRVFYKGEEITHKIHIGFDWSTQTDVTVKSPMIHIEHATSGKLPNIRTIKHEPLDF